MAIAYEDDAQPPQCFCKAARIWALCPWLENNKRPGKTIEGPRRPSRFAFPGPQEQGCVPDRACTHACRRTAAPPRALTRAGRALPNRTAKRRSLFSLTFRPGSCLLPVPSLYKLTFRRDDGVREAGKRPGLTVWLSRCRTRAQQPALPAGTSLSAPRRDFRSPYWLTNAASRVQSPLSLTVEGVNLRRGELLRGLRKYQTNPGEAAGSAPSFSHLPPYRHLVNLPSPG